MGKIGSFLVILFFTFSANAAVKVTATVDRNIVGLGDSLQYTITVESDSGVSVGAPRLPVIEGFEFVGRSQNSQFMSTFDMSKGKLVSNRQENYVFEFQANKEGKFVLGATEVVVDGKPFQTNKIEITVGPKSSNVAQQGGGSADEDESESGEDNDPFSQLLRQHGFRGFKTAPPQNLNQAFFIQLEVDKTEAFVNEQVTASWYIYTRYNITDIDTLKYPALQKFWKEDVEVATRLNFTQEIVNGIPYRKALLARYALFPLKPGDAVVDEYKAKCMVLTDSIFGSFGFNRPRSYTRSSQTAKINVKALPKEGMPSDFSGAVGAFDVSASISSPVVKVNEPFTYKIRWQGRGNAKRIELPPLQIPTSLEEYDTKVESRYNTDGTSYKEFELLYVPREPGKVTIPSFSISYFDPEDKQYHQKTVAAQDIEVTGTPNLTEYDGSNGTDGTSAIVEKKETLPGPTIQFSELGFIEKNRKTIWGSLFLALFLLLSYRTADAMQVFAKERDIEQLISEKFKKVKKLESQKKYRDVGSEAVNALNLILGELAGEGGASESVQMTLQRVPPSVRLSIEKPLRELLAYFETLGFSPEAVYSQIPKKDVKKRLQDLQSLLIQGAKLSKAEDQEG